MRKNKKIAIFVIFLIMWALVIFAMSNMNTQESNGKSKFVIYKVLTYSISATNKLGITNKHPSDEKIYQVINLLNKPLRKVAHATEYFILVILIIMTLKSMGIDSKKVFSMSLLLCFLYACGDEFHQSFISGRTAQFSDSLIDLSGGLIGCIIFYFINRTYENKILSNEIKS